MKKIYLVNKYVEEKHFQFYSLEGEIWFRGYIDVIVNERLSDRKKFETFRKDYNSALNDAEKLEHTFFKKHKVNKNKEEVVNKETNYKKKCPVSDKICHNSRKKAIHSFRNYKKDFRVYFCKKCNYWHVTTT